MQLMGRLCQVIVGALHELLTSNIRVMSAAALASLFLEMNFIEGIIPSSLKNDQFDDSIEQSYELMLRRLLELVKRKPPSSSSQLGQVRCCWVYAFLLRTHTAALRFSCLRYVPSTELSSCPHGRIYHHHGSFRSLPS